MADQTADRRQPPGASLPAADRSRPPAGQEGRPQRHAGHPVRVDRLPIDPDLPDAVGEPDGREPNGEVSGAVGPQSFAPPTPVRPRKWDIALVVSAGGAIGGAIRWSVNQALPTVAGGFPWSTFIENVTGCFLLAVVMVLLLDVLPPHRYARPFIGIGILGGYTTFSTYTADTRVLLAAGEPIMAMAYLFGSVAAGLLAVLAGLALTRAATGLRQPRRKEQT